MLAVPNLGWLDFREVGLGHRGKSESLEPNLHQPLKDLNPTADLLVDDGFLEALASMVWGACVCEVLVSLCTWMCESIPRLAYLRYLGRC